MAASCSTPTTVDQARAHTSLPASVGILESRESTDHHRGCTRPPPIRITATSVRVRRSPQHRATPTRAPRAHEVPGYAPSGGCKGEQADGQSRAPPADPEHPHEEDQPPTTCGTRTPRVPPNKCDPSHRLRRIRDSALQSGTQILFTSNSCTHALGLAPGPSQTHDDSSAAMTTVQDQQ